MLTLLVMFAFFPTAILGAIVHAISVLCLDLGTDRKSEILQYLTCKMGLSYLFVFSYNIVLCSFREGHLFFTWHGPLQEKNF